MLQLSPTTRRGSVLILCVGLITAMVLMVTAFLSEVMGQRASGKDELKRELARRAAAAGREHAFAVLDHQYSTEPATSPFSDYLTAFLPKWHSTKVAVPTLGTVWVPDDGNDNPAPFQPPYDVRNQTIVPGWGRVSAYDRDYWKAPMVTTHAPSTILSWGSWNAFDEIGGTYTRLPTFPTSTYDVYSRFINYEWFDENLQVCAKDDSFYLARYDVSLMELDSTYYASPDFGPDSAAADGQGSIFNTQNSRMLPTDDMRIQYKMMHARNLASVAIGVPFSSWEGELGAPGYSDVLIRNDAFGNEWIEPASWGERFSVGPGGAPLMSLAHLNRGSALLYSPDIKWGEYWREYHRHYTQDTTRHVADLFMGAGITRLMNKTDVYYHAGSMTVDTDHSDRSRNGGDVRQGFDYPGIYGMAGDRSFSPKQSWTQIDFGVRSYKRDDFEQYQPFGAGIVNNDPSLPMGAKTDTMDVGGVPWRINPLIATDSTLRRLIGGLSPQLVYGTGDTVQAHSIYNDGASNGEGDTILRTRYDAYAKRYFHFKWPDASDIQKGNYQVGSAGNVKLYRDTEHSGDSIWYLAWADKDGDNQVDQSSDPVTNEITYVLRDLPQVLKREAPGGDQFYDGPDDTSGRTKVDQYGYFLGRFRAGGTGALEVLADPRMPNESDHAKPAAVKSWQSAWPAELADYVWAAVTPFYDPAQAGVPYNGNDYESQTKSLMVYGGIFPYSKAERPHQLYFWLDGWDNVLGSLKIHPKTRTESEMLGDGVANDALPYDAKQWHRWFNRYIYINWLQWRHDFSTASAPLEQILAEYNAPISYEEGMRYYRRPSALDLRVDIAKHPIRLDVDNDGNVANDPYLTKRQPFDMSAQNRGFHIHSSEGAITERQRIHDLRDPAQIAAAHTLEPAAADLEAKTGAVARSGVDRYRPGQWPPYAGAISSVSRYDAWRNEDAASDGLPRYRIFPHTYPGPMWTGREGKAVKYDSSAGLLGTGGTQRWRARLLNRPRWLKDGSKPDGIAGYYAGTSDSNSGYYDGVGMAEWQMVENSGRPSADNAWNRTFGQESQPSVRSYDSYMADVLAAALASIEHHEQVAKQQIFDAIPMIVTVEDMDRTLCDLLDLYPYYPTPRSYFSFGQNVLVQNLYNPVTPVETTAGGSDYVFDYATISTIDPDNKGAIRNHVYCASAGPDGVPGNGDDLLVPRYDRLLEDTVFNMMGIDWNDDEFGRAARPGEGGGLVKDINTDGNPDLNEDLNGNNSLDAGEDWDGDGRLDTGEDVNNNGALDPGEDVDGDGVLDLNEDLNNNGRFDINEQVAGVDWDSDGKLDAGEDVNNNGILDPGEDIDGDGILDLTEDLDRDGRFDLGEDIDGDGHFDIGEDIDGDGHFDIGLREHRGMNRHDWNNDGVVDLDDQAITAMMPAIQEPTYIYLQYNRYWPVSDPRIPAYEYKVYQTTYGGVMNNLTNALYGRSGYIPSGLPIRIGIDETEIFNFTGDDFHYSWKRACVLASRVVNDIRMSLFGAGNPQTIGQFVNYWSVSEATHPGTAPWINEVSTSSGDAALIQIGGRSQDYKTIPPKPFSRTGRVVIDKSRFFRVLVRGQLINLTVPYEEHAKDLVETYLDLIYCIDPNDDGDPEDGRLLYQRQTSSSRNTRNL